MTAPHEPEAGEVVVTGDELWWRQCPTGKIYYDDEKGQPSNLMFRWTDADAGKLSGAREQKATAEQAYRHRAEVEKVASNGTWGVPASVAGEVGQLIDDSANLPAPPASPPGHTYLDLRHVANGDSAADKRERERVRSRLLIAAKKHYPEAAGA